MGVAPERFRALVPDVKAVVSGDLSKLTHTGNVSVQLQPPGTGDILKGLSNG